MIQKKRLVHSAVILYSCFGPVVLVPRLRKFLAGHHQSTWMLKTTLRPVKRLRRTWVCFRFHKFNMTLGLLRCLLLSLVSLLIIVSVGPGTV